MRKRLEKRLAELEATKEQAIANVNAIAGGIVTVKDLLKELDEAEAAEAKKVEEEASGTKPLTKGPRAKPNGKDAPAPAAA